MVKLKENSFQIILVFLSLLFCFRVFAHLAIVLIGEIEGLPPQSEWLSGALPYKYLLITQIVIIFLLFKVCLDFIKHSGFFFSPNKYIAKLVLPLGITYFAIMVIRYTIRMSLYPQERWLGGSIPVFFHVVLAVFLILLAYYHINNYEPIKKTETFTKRISTNLIKYFLSIITVTLIILWVLHTILPTIISQNLGIGPPEFAVRAEKNVIIPTSDGINLSANIYRPIRSGMTPTILVRIPYTANLYNSYRIDLISRIWAEHGFNVVIQGTRGRGQSEGEYYPFRHEHKDGLVTLEWIGKQSWFNGSLGMWGGSYFGYTQWVLADQKNPGPNTLGIQIASTNFYEMFYVGGAFSLESAVHWALTSGPYEDKEYSQEQFKQAMNGFPIINADNRAGQNIEYFDEWVSHTKNDEFWEEINNREMIKHLSGPVHLMSGWYDPFLASQLKDFELIRKHSDEYVANETTLIVGPWAHARDITLPSMNNADKYRISSLSPSINWFNKHLKKKTIPNSNPVKIFVMGENIWRNETSWPLARTVYEKFFLHSIGHSNSINGGGTLSQTSSPLDKSVDEYIFDPGNPVPSIGGSVLGPRSGMKIQNSIEERDDVLVYTSDPLQKNMEVTGPIKLNVFVSSSAPSTDFTAKLVDVHPDGSAYNISEGILRIPKGEINNNSASKITIQLSPTSNVFLKNHQIRLEISSSNFPRFDLNPNTGTYIPHETTYISAEQKIFTGNEYASHLVLPIIPRVEKIP